MCGARGGGDAAVRSLYWVAHKNLTFMLVLDSERERNAALMLARRFAFDVNVCSSTTLVHPKLLVLVAPKLSLTRNSTTYQATKNCSQGLLDDVL